MIKTSVYMLTGLFLFMSQVALANSEFESKCAQWAIDDEIPEEERASYIKNCVQNMIDDQKEGESQPQD